jgi:hypothetical protein
MKVQKEKVVEYRRTRAGFEKWNHIGTVDLRSETYCLLESEITWLGRH